MSGAAGVSEWDQLVAVGVLGLGRANVRMPVIAGKPGELLAQSPVAEGPLAFLRAAAVTAVYERAGRRPGAAQVTRTNACPPDDVPSCSFQSGQHLSRILFGEYGHLLNEWCTAARSPGVRAPDELLPALLQRLKKARADDRGDAIAAVLGERGRWLAAMNPEWRATVAPSDDPTEVWRTGTQAHRLAVIRRLRREQPDAVRAMIQQTWPRESPEDREAFVSALEIRLSSGDEPFLEAALDDNRKSVRQTAADLLARLPESSFCARMAVRAKAALTIEQQKRLLRGSKLRISVQLPEKPDKAAARDGIEYKRRGGMGERANTLCQLLGAAPLTLWERCGAGHGEIIEAAGATEWREPLLRGWTQAAIRQRSAAWAEPMLSLLLNSESEADGEDARSLLSAIEPAARERVLTDAFRAVSVSYARGLRLLDSCTHAWSERFSRAVLAALRNYFGTPEAYSEHALRNMIKQHVAGCLTPSLAAEAEKGWSQSSAHWHKGDEDMATTLAATLAFRHGMLEELKR